MAAYVNNIDNAHFELIVANPPRNKSIEFLGLEAILTDELANNFPSELDELSSHTRVKGVTDIDIDSITISEDGINVTGTASVEVSLQCGSDIEQESGDEIYDFFPFKFDISLDLDLSIKNINGLEIDNSSFYQ
jgi:hypothetical protein